MGMDYPIPKYVEEERIITKKKKTSHIEYQIECKFCGQLCWVRRVDARFCSDGCRKLENKRKKEKIGKL